MDERLTDEEIEEIAVDYAMVSRTPIMGGGNVYHAVRMKRDDVIEFARAVLARAAVPVVQPQEPVAWRFTHNRGHGMVAYTYHDNEPSNDYRTAYRDTCIEVTPLYAAPLARQEPVSLSESQRELLVSSAGRLVELEPRLPFSLRVVLPSLLRKIAASYPVQPSSEAATAPWETPDAPELFRFINSTPLVASLLYDINLLPEQINNPRHWNYMVAACQHMEAALSSTPAQGDGGTGDLSAVDRITDANRHGEARQEPAAAQPSGSEALRTIGAAGPLGDPEVVEPFWCHEQSHDRARCDAQCAECAEDDAMGNEALAHLIVQACHGIPATLPKRVPLGDLHQFVRNIVRLSRSRALRGVALPRADQSKGGA